MAESASSSHIPNAVKQERALLGSLFADPEKLYTVKAELRPSEFYDRRNRWIYEAMCDVIDRHGTLDREVVMAELKRRITPNGSESLLEAIGPLYISEIDSGASWDTPVELQIEYIKTTAVQRQLVEGASRIADLAYSGINPDTDEPMTPGELLARAEHTIIDIDASTKTDTVHAVQFAESLGEVQQEQARHSQGEGIDGIDPVLQPLRDTLPYGVYQKGWLIGVGANPKIGKSRYVINVAAKALVDGKNVCLVATEMLATENGERLVPLLTHWLKDEGIPQLTVSQLVRKVKNEYDEEGIATKQHAIQAIQEFSDWYDNKCEGKLVIIDNPVKVSSLRSYLAKQQMKWGQFDLVIIDHIGMLLPETDRYMTETQKMNEVAKDVLRLCRTELLGNPTTVFVSAFNKGEDTDKPSLQRFRDTFMLAYNSHVLIGMYKDAEGNTLMNLPGIRSPSPTGHFPEPTPVVFDSETHLVSVPAGRDLPF